MSSSRSPGRYNLHRLGWTAFEDLCMQVMRVVLGETCTRFRPGPDGGRDGWFAGSASGLLASQRALSGSFVIQSKHTSMAHQALDASDLTKDIEKLRKIASASPCHYLLMTNRQVSAQAEARIRAAVEALSGVGTCNVLAETWIEDTIDAHPRLLRLVPRLYGIGDLSQIVSFVLQEQTRAVLDDLAVPLRTFVPTDSYRRAEKALHEHGFVVLVGPPASGKTAIAANLCMVNLAQDPNVRVLRIEHAEQFKATWSPAESNTIYWVDDVFGETTLDEARLREWSAALDKVEAARRRQARIVFCTRDYILAAAERKLKRSRADFISDARVRVDVTSLSPPERDAILYNHIKDGSITRGQKGALKKFLPALASRPSFSPELARRLGASRFHGSVRYEKKSLERFFDDPVQHFRDVIHGLSSSEMAALAACLHSGNALPDPVPETAVGGAVLATYGVSLRELRESLEALEGSLVKRVRQSTAQYWQLHHPSMLDALQDELASRPAHLILYLDSAELGAVLLNTTTEAAAPNARLIFVPDAAYHQLIRRLAAADARSTDKIASYLADKACSTFLSALERSAPEVIDRALALVLEPEGSDASISLAVRLSETSLLDSRRRAIVQTAVLDAVDESGWCGFLDVDGASSAIPGLAESILAREAECGFQSIERLYDWYAQDLSAEPLVQSAIEALDSHCRRLEDALASDTALPDASRIIRVTRERFDRLLAERRDEIEENEQRRADYLQDEWKEQYYEDKYELENGRFADVDE